MTYFSVTRMALLVFLGLSFQLHSQIQFERRFSLNGNDYPRTIRHTEDGGYLLAGYGTSHSPFNNVAQVVRTNKFGDTLWSRRYLSPNGLTAEGYSIVEKPDGTLWFAGTIRTGPNRDPFIAFLDSMGEVSSAQIFESSGGDDEFYWIENTVDGGAILGGRIANPDYQATLVKLDANGQVEWSHAYGGSQWEICHQVKQTVDGGYIGVGYSTDFMAAGSFDMFLFKTDSLGSLMWSRTYGGSTWDQAFSVVPTHDGGYAMAGHSNSFSANTSLDINLIKTDSIGDIEWARAYGTTDFEPEYAHGLIQLEDSSYVISGYSGGANVPGTFMIKFDQMGDTLWTRNYTAGFSSIGYSVVQTCDQGLAIGTFGLGIIKTDEDGLTGCGSQDVPLETYSFAPAVSNMGSQTAGLSGDTLVLQSDPISWTLSASCFLVDTLEASFSDSVTNLSVDFSNHSTGSTDWLWDFGDGSTDTSFSPSHPYTTPGNYQVCLTAYGECGISDQFCDSITVEDPTGVHDLQGNGIRLFPNPVQLGNQLTIDGLDNPGKGVIRFFNQSGKLVLNINLPENASIPLDRNTFTPGLYFIEVEWNSHRTVHKLVVL